MKKKNMLKGILIALILIIGLILYLEKINKIEIIKNIKNAISMKMESLTEQIKYTENIQITTIDITNIEDNGNLEHEHIYETKYDENNHWKECKVCKQKNDIVVHNYTSNWTQGSSSSCSINNVNVYVCDCGYSYQSTVGRSPHTLKYITNYGEYSRFYQCQICSYRQPENYHDCYKSDGTRITCSNLGRCSSCNFNWTSASHSCVYSPKNPNSYCSICKVKNLAVVNRCELVKVSDNTFKFYTSITVPSGSRMSKPFDNIYFGAGVTTSDSYSSSGNTWSNVATINFTGHNENLGSITTAYIYMLNGIQYTVQLNTDWFYVDTEPPVISKITTENQYELNDWSRKKTIIVTGTENYCNTVKVDIIDENEKIICSGETTVVNGNYTISLIPEELEIDLEEKVFKAIVTDRCQNVTEQKFSISKVDMIAPTPISGDKILGDWAKSKDFTFSATDYGIGQVSIAFNDMEDLQLANVDGNIYSRDYTFIGDVYSPKQLSVLYKDGLGNASIQKITIDKLDNTVPTITNATLNKNKLVVEANDEHEILGEGSGVVKYKYITSDKKLVNPEVTEDCVELSDNEILIEDIYKAKYIYVVVEDLVGNVSDVYEIILPELILDTEVDLSLSDGKGGVNLDWSTYDATNKVFKAYHRKDDIADADWEMILNNDNATKFTDNLVQDVKAPDAPTMSAGQVGITKDIQISFNTKDNGSTYSFYVEAYDSEDTSIKLSVSNEKTETVTTGTKGYYYIIDEDSENKDFDIISPVVQYTTDENILVHISNNGKHIHMKADDKAGNVSEPSTYKIDLKIIDIDEEITIELTKTWIDNNIQRFRRPDKLRFVVVPLKDAKEGETISSNNNVLEDNTILSKGDSAQKDSEEQKDEISQERVELNEIVKEEIKLEELDKEKPSGEKQSSSLDEEKIQEENNAEESNKFQQTHEILNKSDETVKSRTNIRLQEEKDSANKLTNRVVDKEITTNEISNKVDNLVNNNIEKIENTVKPNELENIENVTNSNKSEELDEENISENQVENKTENMVEDKKDEATAIEDTKTEDKLETPKLDSTQANSETNSEENIESSENIESYIYEFEVDKEVSSQVFNLAGILRYDQTTGKPMKYIIREEEVNEGDLKFYETTGGEVQKIADSEGNIVKYRAEIINKFKLPENNTKEVKVTKVWNDDNQITKRPTSVILELIGRVKDIQIIEESEAVEQQSDAEEIVKITETPKQEEQTNEIMPANNNEFYYKTISSKEGRVSAESEWKHTYTGLPIYDENGQEIEYIAQEKEGQVALNKYISEVSKINESNEITVTNSLIIRNSIISKTGLEEITSVDSNVPYNIDYETELDNKYTENMVIEIVDTLPYEIDEEKSDLKGGEYNYNEGTKVATITWRGTYNPTSKTITLENDIEENSSAVDNPEVKQPEINQEVIENIEKNTHTLKVHIDIGVTYKNINVLNEKIINKVSGKITLSNNVEQKVEGTFETRTRWIRNVTVTKLWKGDIEETRPESIELQLSASAKDENNVGSEYILDESIETTKSLSKDTDWTETLWTNLPSYDEFGKEINYTVQEINIDGYKSEILEINKNGSDIEITIQNTKLYKLPITGGIGVDTIRSLEVLVGIIALILLTNRKKIVPSRRSVIKAKGKK